MTLSNFWQASEQHKFTKSEYEEALRIIQINKSLTSELARKFQLLKSVVCQEP